MNIEDKVFKVLGLLKEKPMLMSEIEDKLGLSVADVIDVGVLPFLRKYKLAEITPTNEGGLVKITEKGLHLLNLPDLPEGTRYEGHHNYTLYQTPSNILEPLGNQILEMIKEKPLSVNKLRKELELSASETIDVLMFLEKRTLIEATTVKGKVLEKITPQGVQLLNLPNLLEEDTTEEWIDQREHEIGDSIRCIICDQLCKNAYGLANHVTKTHKMFFSEYKRHVLAEAENECNEMKQIATKYLKQINVIGYPMSKYKNIRHLLLLLKEGWK
jgi:CTP-dependent riboflavin kinase